MVNQNLAKNLIPAKVKSDSPEQQTYEPLSKILVIGHGDLAVRQRPTYEHWLQQGIEVHCADTDPSKLEDCLAGIHRHDLSDPGEEDRMLAAGTYDLLCINNFPELHLVSALKYGTHARQIIIQKPQDLNFPLIRTIAHAPGLEEFRRKTKIHDHYRNKGAVPALLEALPGLHTDFGRFRRLLFFLTESRSVSDPREEARAGSLKCGMIQDLAVHMFDLLFESIYVETEWRHSQEDDRLHRRVDGTIQIVACPKFREQNSELGDTVETFAVIDLHIVEIIEFPAGSSRRQSHEFDALIAVGKGLNLEQGVSGDLKVIAAEFERPDYGITVDLTTQGTVGIQDYLPAGLEINRHHGGLNRPLMLISPNPPDHALRGLGGLEYPQWQTLSLGEHVASNADVAKQTTSSYVMDAYPPERPLGDFLRELALRTQAIRPIWGNLRPLIGQLIRLPRLDEHYE